MKQFKKALLENPDKLVEFLSEFDFCKFSKHYDYVSFARDEDGSPKSLVIRLHKNDYLYITDYPLNINMDLIAYIMQQRNVKFIDVLSVLKRVLNIDNYYSYRDGFKAFGGFYSNIKKRKKHIVKTYSSDILKQYDLSGNQRFLNDGIDLKTQQEFNIGYSVEEQAITIPIYDIYGQLIGVKARVNRDNVAEFKYFYLVPCNMSQTLYGYCQNYDKIQNNTVYVFESEKSVMQCHSMGVENCVAIGSSSLSNTQASLIASLQPTQIVLLFDEGLPFETIERNINILKPYLKFLNTKILYWDSTLDIDIPIKSSLSDLGKERFLYGIKNELKEYDIN